MNEHNQVILHTTVGSEADAQTLAQRAIEKRLAACVHIDPIRSVYRWQGQVQQDSEWRLTFKTTTQRLHELVEDLKTLHPYDLPAFYTVPATPQTPEWGRWVEDELKLP
jgi:periplasmic divalent cation tolerance protein